MRQSNHHLNNLAYDAALPLYSRAAVYCTNFFG
jgi:hypothetical protein